jgi:tetrapyrrole methylase family protein/MazG family protein
MDSDSVHRFSELIEIVRTLRGPNGCEWDKAQTHDSLTPYLLEEAHEVIDSITEHNPAKIKEELGDLMLHIVFQAQIATESGEFTLADSIEHINSKLVRRHPHVFGSTEVKNVGDIKKNWEVIKMKEGRRSLMDGLPKSLPALLQARRVQERAAQVGFDWDAIEPVWAKITEETAELQEAIDARKKDEIIDEFGDLLFTIVNLSRFLEIDPEEALRHTVNKFIRRFQAIEKELTEKGEDIKDTPLSELDEIWNRLKDEETR